MEKQHTFTPKPLITDKIIFTGKYSIVFWGIVFGVVYWFAESFVHSQVFYGRSFYEELFPTEPNEIWMRTFVVVLFICFAGLVQIMSSQRRKLKAEMLLKTEKVQQTLKLQSAALKAAANGILICAADGKIEWVNAAFTELTGYSSSESIGKIPDSLLGSGLHDKTYYQTFWDKIQKGEVWQGEFINRHKNGSLYTIEQTITPILDNKGQIEHFIGVMQDITERKQAEKANAQSEKRFQMIVDSEPECVKIVSADGILLSMNPAGLKMIDADSPRLVVGKSVFGLVIPEYHDVFRQSITDGLMGKESQIQFQICGLKGRLLWMDSHVVPFPDEDGRITGILALTRDVSLQKKAEIALISELAERKKAEAKISQLNAELEQRVKERTFQLEAANKELESFSYSVSHDLRAPLRAINGFSQILVSEKSSLLDEDGIRCLAVISENASRMGHLIDALLTLSRLGRYTSVPARIDMKTMASDMFSSLVKYSASDHIEFRLQKLPDAYEDPDLVRQVWQNLIENAIKFSSKNQKPVIEVGFNSENGKIVYFVKDNGVGFDMKYADKIFGVFQRLHSVKEFEGTGIGLALVQRIIHRFGGHIWAEGRVNEGAAFYFSFPGGENSE